ncbi:hypothetical protein Tco_1378106 [Tanacetum coccineum]
MVEGQKIRYKRSDFEALHRPANRLIQRLQALHVSRMEMKTLRITDTSRLTTCSWTMEHFPIARVNFFAYFVGESCKQDEKSDEPHGESFNLEMREEQFASFATIISQRMEKVNELCGSPYFVDQRKENFSGTNVEEEFDL